MAFFNIFKMNFLKPYYRTFSPNKETDFTPTIQQEDFFQGVLGSNALDDQTL
ncbi:hypothetical protein [Helicobacter pylori]|uniref:hypothetical protein n=1 Tax=Helicobacter pylori TaxID=210 RepID=UPI001ABACCDB|nr:hypothetical protein [Helicobacter pylori]